MSIGEENGSGMQLEYLPVEVLQRKVESQIPKDIVTSGMPPEYIDTWRKNYAFLIATAISFRRLAQNPRDFFVGGSMCYWDKKSDQGDVAFDANFKHSPNQLPPKMCAERRMLRQLHLGSLISQKGEKQGQATLADMAEPKLDVVGLVVASDKATTTRPGEEPEDAYKEKRSVLHPCGECLDLLSHDNLIKPWTRMVMINNSDRDHLVIEDRSIGELLSEHGITQIPPQDYEKYIQKLIPDLKLFK